MMELLTMKMLSATIISVKDTKEARRLAARALVDINTIDALAAVLTKGIPLGFEYTEDWDTRRTAAENLGRLGKPEATPPLIYALKNDREMYVREAAAKALGKLGGPGAIQALIAAFKNDENESVRRSAAKALGRLDSPEVAQALKAQERPKEVPKIIIGKDGAHMVLIPAGDFEMGSNDGRDDEKPVHTVYVDAFYKAFRR